MFVPPDCLSFYVQGWMPGWVRTIWLPNGLTATKHNLKESATDNGRHNTSHISAGLGYAILPNSRNKFASDVHRQIREPASDRRVTLGKASQYAGTSSIIRLRGSLRRECEYSKARSRDSLMSTGFVESTCSKLELLSGKQLTTPGVHHSHTLCSLELG